jgi:SPP1 gp7 family putative phage head morphogenesis protein
MPQGSITTLYSTVCTTCGGYHNVSETNIFTDEEMNMLIDGVLTGIYSAGSLPAWYYERTAEALFSGVEAGFGSNLFELSLGGTDYALLAELRTNIYVFSAAKTYQQVRDMSDLLVTYKDRPDLFKKEAKKIFQDYNTPKGANYLSAEYQTAKSSARSAKNWQRIESDKGVLEILEYQTVGDSRVRPEHAELDGIKRPVDDSFWNNYYPPNGWRCRCDVLQHEEGDITSLKGFKQPESVPESFMMNSGKDRLIFSEKHPYFKVKRGDKQLAMDNFNLPLP